MAGSDYRYRGIWLKLLEQDFSSLTIFFTDFLLHLLFWNLNFFDRIFFGENYFLTMDIRKNVVYETKNNLGFKIFFWYVTHCWSEKNAGPKQKLCTRKSFWNKNLLVLKNFLSPINWTQKAHGCLLLVPRLEFEL